MIWCTRSSAAYGTKRSAASSLLTQGVAKPCAHNPHILQSFPVAWSQKVLPTEFRQRPKRWGGQWASMVTCFMAGCWCTTIVLGLVPALEVAQAASLPFGGTCERAEEVEVMDFTAFLQQPQTPASILGQQLSASRTPLGRQVRQMSRAFLKTPPSTNAHLGLSFNQPPSLQARAQTLRPPRGCP